MPDIITAATTRRAQRRSGPATLNELLYRFQSTPEIRDTGGENKRQIKRAVRQILEKFDRLPIAELEDRSFRSAIYDWRDEMAERRVACERTIRILSRALAWGADRNFVRANHAQEIKFRWQKSSRAEVVWTPCQILDLREHGGDIAGACEIALWTALRQGDVLDLLKSQVKDGWIIVTPKKTERSSGVVVRIPYALFPPLQRVVDQLLAADNDSPYLLGRRWPERTFRHRFEAVKKAAGLESEDLHFHDLRGTLSTWLLEAGCTEAEASSISGHALAEGTLRAYAARTKALPEAAYHKLRAYMDDKHDDWYCTP